MREMALDETGTDEGKPLEAVAEASVERLNKPDGEGSVDVAAAEGLGTIEVDNS